jgi:hypothetical protein
MAQVDIGEVSGLQCSFAKGKAREDCTERQQLCKLMGKVSHRTGPYRMGVSSRCDQEHTPGRVLTRRVHRLLQLFYCTEMKLYPPKKKNPGSLNKIFRSSATKAKIDRLGQHQSQKLLYIKGHNQCC